MAVKNQSKYQAIVIGASAGGHAALNKLLPALTADLPVPVIIIHHMHPEFDDYSIRQLYKKCALNVKIAEEKEPVEPGNIYFGPPNYHLLIEQDKTFSLSVSAPVNYARPSIDVLFESASDVYQDKLIGVILTGANDDGSNGLKTIKNRRGVVIVQNPAEAEMSKMPESALRLTKIDYVLNLNDIASKLLYILRHDI